MAVKSTAWPWRSAVAILPVMMLMLPQAVRAQGLGEAARKAEEQRKAAGPSTKLIGIPEAAVFQEVPLSEDLVNQFALARAAVAQWLWDHPDRRQYLLEWASKLKRGRDLVQVYESEPQVMERITFHGFTLEGFLRVLRTIDRTRARVSKEDQYDYFKDKPTELIEANTRFMAGNYLLFKPLFSSWASSATSVPSASFHVPY
jgi:hypothetical protein